MSFRKSTIGIGALVLSAACSNPLSPGSIPQQNPDAHVIESIEHSYRLETDKYPDRTPYYVEARAIDNYGLTRTPDSTQVWLNDERVNTERRNTRVAGHFWNDELLSSNTFKYVVFAGEKTASDSASFNK